MDTSSRDALAEVFGGGAVRTKAANLIQAIENDWPLPEPALGSEQIRLNPTKTKIGELNVVKPFGNASVLITDALKDARY